jgi:metal-dependent amidase/aminoacylase/carboxypeptidase family protein
MDICLMCHPAPGPKGSISLSSTLALQRIEVEYTGHTYIMPAFCSYAIADLTLCSAHAALSPWEGQNALDAAVIAYTSIAVLRQQVKPTHRIHGIISGRDWAPNGMSSFCV